MSNLIFNIGKLVYHHGWQINITLILNAIFCATVLSYEIAMIVLVVQTTLIAIMLFSLISYQDLKRKNR